MTTLLKLSGPAIGIGGLLIFGAIYLDRGIGPMYLAGVALVVAGVVAQWVRTRRQRPTKQGAPTGAGVGAIRVEAPVSGRWRGLNSPASKVPSHTHAFGQTYAIDVTYEPEGAEPRTMDLWPIMRRPSFYPSCGQPVLAPADGVVINAEDSRRDHLARLSWLGLLYLIGEGVVRSLGGAQHLLGNYVMIRTDDGTVAVMAHLRRESLRVAAGARVTAGQTVAECGNSGNSSDPHVHFQLMDGEDINTARGLPFEWCYADVTGETRAGVPTNNELFVPVAVSASEAPTQPGC